MYIIDVLNYNEKIFIIEFFLYLEIIGIEDM